MHRSPSRLAQLAFDIVNRLSYYARHSGPLGQVTARATNRVARFLLRRTGTGHTVQAIIYGHTMTMPAEHTIAHTLQCYPQYNRPLGLACRALMNQSGRTGGLSIVDVGANIGETVAIVDQQCPGVASYLCIDADKDLADLCSLNHRGNSRVETRIGFIGENEGQRVRLIDDGRANPSTQMLDDDTAQQNPNGGRLVSLDTIATPFAEAHAGIDLIKVDTEGYDFSILRSGSRLLQRYKPALYFEWYPKLLAGIGEAPPEGFQFLQGHGYRYFVFFTSLGDYYCRFTGLTTPMLNTLAHVTLRDNFYFDVFATHSEPLCDEIVRLAVESECSDAWRCSSKHQSK